MRSKTSQITIKSDQGNLTIDVSNEVIGASFLAARNGEAFLYECDYFVIEVERSEDREWSSAIDHLLDGSDFIYCR